MPNKMALCVRQRYSQAADLRQRSGSAAIPRSTLTASARPPTQANSPVPETVDWALELGVGIGSRYDWLRGTAEVRQGINGHDGQVIELGMDFITAPVESLQLNFGPRLSWASGNYMDTYFGVSDAEALHARVALKRLRS